MPAKLQDFRTNRSPIKGHKGAGSSGLQGALLRAAACLELVTGTAVSRPRGPLHFSPRWSVKAEDLPPTPHFCPTRQPLPFLKLWGRGHSLYACSIGCTSEDQ